MSYTFFKDDLLAYSLCMFRLADGNHPTIYCTYIEKNMKKILGKSLHQIKTNHAVRFRKFRFFYGKIIFRFSAYVIFVVFVGGQPAEKEFCFVWIATVYLIMVPRKNYDKRGLALHVLYRGTLLKKQTE